MEEPPTLLLYVPPGHSVQLEVPTSELYVPAPHAWQTCEELAPTAVENVPEAQAAHVPAPANEKKPCGHGTQFALELDADNDEYRPALQDLQFVLPSISVYVPAGHGEHADCPANGA